MTTEFKTLISAETLREHLDDSDLVVLDGTWFLPTMNRDGRTEYESTHIPGAVFFDIDATSDPDHPMPHMIPSEEKFSADVESLGISSNSKIVIYDVLGMFSAARVWWLFRLFGHQQVAVLDGGLPAWIEAGYPVTPEIHQVTTGSYTAKLRNTLVVDLEEMQSVVAAGDTLILDARTAGRFSGADPEPRPELQSGHMPGASSLPVSQLLRNGKFRNKKELQEIFDAFPFSESGAITSCGSGVTAAIITLAMEHCGRGMHRLYDGSWTEWASNPLNPIEKGA